MYQEELMKASRVNNKGVNAITFHIAWLLVLISVIFCQQISARNINDKIQQLSDGWAHVNFGLGVVLLNQVFQKLVVA